MLSPTAAPETLATPQWMRPSRPSHDADSDSSASNDKKETNWHALLLADNPDEVAVRTQTPPPASDVHTPISNSPGSPSDSSKPGGTTDILIDRPTAHENTTGSPTPATQPSGEGRPHTVQRGETFSSISKAAYGSSRYFRQIIAANPTVNPNRLRPGTVINLPDISAVKASASSVAGKINQAGIGRRRAQAHSCRFQDRIPRREWRQPLQDLPAPLRKRRRGGSSIRPEQGNDWF